jgi:non-lysosomal glucosylceramidase
MLSALPRGFCILLSSVSASSLFDALAEIPFLNGGLTRANDSFHFETIAAVGESQIAIYLEADNVSCLNCTAWSDENTYFTPHSYLFKDRDSKYQTAPSPAPASTPGPSGWVDLGNADWNDPSAVFKNGTENIQKSEEKCKKQCATLSICAAGLFMNGTVRHGECWLATRSAAFARLDFCGAAAGQDCAAFQRQAVLPSKPGVYNGVSPASGMRSAVPLGGISAGSFELRGDGSFHEWFIHNAGPNGAAKIQQYPFAYLAMSIDGEARAIRTHPETGIRGVDGLRYGGTYPVSKLEVVDTQFTSLSANVYAFSAVHVGDMRASSRPGVAFALALENRGVKAVNVSFMVNLPLAVEVDQARRGTAIPEKDKLAAKTAEACRRLCLEEPNCLSWRWTASSATCLLQSDAPMNQYALGTTSGLRDSWSVSTDGSQCLTLSRPGLGPMHGNLSLCASADGCSSSGCWDSIVSDDPVANFAWLSTDAGSSDPLAAYGAIRANAIAQPGQNTTLQLTLGWSFPRRDHYNYDFAAPASFQAFGNQYATWFPGGSVESAWGSAAPGSERAAALLKELEGIRAYHEVLIPPGSDATTSMPSWLQDLLVNSLSHSRNSMWWENCPRCHPSQDSRVDPSSWGIWRQWEAVDCPNIDSIHNDGERHIPYIMLYTDGERSKLAAWAGNQGADGMLAEQMLSKKPDRPLSRNMSDSSSMFIVYLLELMRWSNDTRSLELYYPTAKRAAQWQMDKSKEFGVPLGLETTYDIMGFPKYQLSAYTSVFHLLAMRATMELAMLSGDDEFAKICEAAWHRGQKAMDKLQWNAQGGYYDAGSSKCTADVDCSEGTGSFADAFYAQVLAYSLGLGELIADPTKLDSHLAATAKSNCVHNNVSTGSLEKGCPNGLVIMTGRPADVADLQVWEMATYNHAALAMHRGAMSASDALAFAEGSGTSYSDRINDQWNIAGVKSNDGFPSITSHYGYHMTSWHLVFALTGQVADLSAKPPRLTFSPKMSCEYVLPVILPGVLGRLACKAGKYSLVLTAGSLTLGDLSVAGTSYPQLPVKLHSDAAVSWAAEVSVWTV